MLESLYKILKSQPEYAKCDNSNSEKYLIIN